MKGSASEENLRFCFDVTSRSLGDGDVALWVSGKNSFVWAAIKKEVSSLRPRVGSRELCLEVDQEQLMTFLRVGSNQVGTIDPQEPYLLMMKSKRAMLQRKSGPRRFVGGNSAFKCMGGLPLLRKAGMLQVSVDEKERCFRGVAPTEKWLPHKARLSAAGATAAATDPDDDEEQDDDLDTAMPDSSGKVVLFWMEMHPKARCVCQSVPDCCLGFRRGFSPCECLQTHSFFSAGVPAALRLHTFALVGGYHRAVYHDVAMHTHGMSSRTIALFVCGFATALSSHIGGASPGLQPAAQRTFLANRASSWAWAYASALQMHGCFSAAAGVPAGFRRRGCIPMQ